MEHKFLKPEYCEQIGAYIDGYSIEAITPTKEQMENRVIPISIRYQLTPEQASLDLEVKKDGKEVVKMPLVMNRLFKKEKPRKTKMNVLFAMKTASDENDFSLTFSKDESIPDFWALGICKNPESSLSDCDDLEHLVMKRFELTKLRKILETVISMQKSGLDLFVRNEYNIIHTDYIRCSCVGQCCIFTFDLYQDESYSPEGQLLIQEYVNFKAGKNRTRYVVLNGKEQIERFLAVVKNELKLEK